MFNYSCEICRDSITDPVCKNCYIKQTLILLNDFEVDSRTSDFISDELKNIPSVEILNDSECILCKKDSLTLCRYCFSVLLIDILKELNFNEELIETFEYNPYVLTS